MMNTELHGLAMSAVLARLVADAGRAPAAIAWDTGLDPLRLEEITTGVGPEVDVAEMIALFRNLRVDDPGEAVRQAVALAEEMEALTA
jgi:hypothetical protein